MKLTKQEELMALSSAIYLLGLEVEASRVRLEELLEGGLDLASPEVRAENETFDRLSVEFTRLEERFLHLEKEIEQEKAEDRA